MSFPDFLLSTLEELNMERARSVKLPAEAFERLLHAFHRKGIFFVNIGTGVAEPQPESFAPGIPDYVMYDEPLVT
jgi:hypothetical protein